MSSRTGTIFKQIGGELRGFSFGMNCWNEFCKIQKIGPDKIAEAFSDSSKQLEVYRDVIYSALVANCEINEKPINFNRFVVGEWIDDMDQKDFNEVIDAMLNSRLLGKNLNGSKVMKEEKAL